MSVRRRRSGPTIAYHPSQTAFCSVAELDQRFGSDPPAVVRALYYDYTFASPEEKARGQWWDRRLLGAYFPASRLK